MSACGAVTVLAGDRVVVYTGMGDYDTGVVFSVDAAGYVIDVDGPDGDYRQWFDASTDVRRRTEGSRRR